MSDRRLTVKQNVPIRSDPCHLMSGPTSGSTVNDGAPVRSVQMSFLVIHGTVRFGGIR